MLPVSELLLAKFARMKFPRQGSQAEGQEKSSSPRFTALLSSLLVDFPFSFLLVVPLFSCLLVVCGFPPSVT